MRTQKSFDPRGALAVALYLAAAKLVLHLLTNGQYGYFRDELYYLACGEHLDWGYVDQAPLIAVVARAERAVLGDSLFAIRFLPALSGAALVFVTGLLARELGGGRFAVVLACVCVIVAPAFLALHTILTMNAFEPLFWTAGAYFVARALKTGDGRYWLWFGLVMGLGLENKHSTLVFGFAVVVGLLLTTARKFFLSKWLWIGGAVAFLIFLPNLLWQISHGWPTVEVLRNADKNQNLPISPLDFFKGQLLLTHPLTFPVWAAGLCFYLFTRAGRNFRALGWAYVVMFVLMIVLRAKVYYLLPVYPVLFAPGGVWFESLFARLAERRSLWRLLRPASVALLVLGGAVTAPLALPVLPVETFIRYQRALGLEAPRTEKLRLAELPQHYADMFGWEEMTRAVASVYNSLPPDERGRCAVFARNYGEAGAIDFFGARYGLPKAIGKHQNYFLWGPRDYTGECVITVGERETDVRKSFDEVELAATITHPYAIPHENNLPVYVCRKPKRPLKEIWPEVKCYSC
ncbi:MAG TPA: glycosyltransferase family 39 protein [Pyrinomonadaceae bacterium]|nr:glycosyltransferase family 39 protein [Pyrinomonadaceae bacterium]